MNVLRWIRKYGWLLAVGIVSVVGALLLPRFNPWDKVKSESRALDAEERAAVLAAELGHEKAVQAIEAEHRQTLEGINDDSRAQLEDLRGDPRKLARRLSELSS